MGLNVSGTGSDADGKSMAALGAQQAVADRKEAEEGGYEFDADDMAENVKELQELRRDKLKELQRLADQLTDVGGLGDEPVSKEYLASVNQSGKSYVKFINGMDELLGGYIEKLKDMVREYRDTEDETASAVEKIANDTDS